MPRGYPIYVLSVMFGINLLNYFDRYIGSVGAVALQAEFHLNDSQIGALASAFLLVYAFAAIPFGAWADRGTRKVVIGIGVAIWSVATFFTALVGSFLQLILSRAVVGVGEASYYPAGTSLLGDYFPKGVRGRATAIWQMGATVGIALGFVGGGIIIDRYGWRPAYLVAGVPGVLFAILAFSLREPLRGAAEPRGPRIHKAHDLSFPTFVGLLRIRTLRTMIVAETMLFFVLAVAAFFLPLFVHRKYSLTIGQAGILAGGVLVTGGLIGTFLGGWLGDRRTRTHPAGHIEVGALGFAVGAVTVAAALVSPTVPMFIAFFFLGAMALYLYNGPFTAMKQMIVLPSLRASGITIGLVISHLFGDSWANWAVGVISDRLHSLNLALLITLPPMLALTTIVALLARGSALRDTEAMEETWARHSPEELEAAAPS